MTWVSYNSSLNKSVSLCEWIMPRHALCLLASSNNPRSHSKNLSGLLLRPLWTWPYRKVCCDLKIQLKFTDYVNNSFNFCPGRLTWLVYIIGAAIGGRVSFTSSDEHDSMDGELVCRFVD